MVLVTTHVPFRDVPALLTVERVMRTGRITQAALRDWFGIAAPRLALCAVNPHAGESGLFGDEEERVLRPAAVALEAAGPLPADTVFVRAMRGEFDAVLAPYHDVGHDGDQGGGVRPGGERHARVAVSADFAGSWDGARHRGDGPGGCVEHAGGDRVGGRSWREAVTAVVGEVRDGVHGRRGWGSLRSLQCRRDRHRNRVRALTLPREPHPRCAQFRPPDRPTARLPDA